MDNEQESLVKQAENSIFEYKESISEDISLLEIPEVEIKDRKSVINQAPVLDKNLVDTDQNDDSSFIQPDLNKTQSLSELKTESKHSAR